MDQASAVFYGSEAAQLHKLEPAETQATHVQATRPHHG